MTEPTEPNRVSALENIIINLEDRIEGLEGQLLALEKRLDQDDSIRDKLREIAAPASADRLRALERRFEDFVLGRFSLPEPDLRAIPGTDLSVRVFDNPPNQAITK